MNPKESPCMTITYTTQQMPVTLYYYSPGLMYIYIYIYIYIHCKSERTFPDHQLSSSCGWETKFWGATISCFEWRQWWHRKFLLTSNCELQAFIITCCTIFRLVCIYTDHGVSHEETRDVRVFSLHLLHMLDHIQHVCVEDLHMHTIALTSAMANWGRKKYNIKSLNLNRISNLRITSL